MLNKSTYFGEKYQISFFFNALFLLLHVPINTIVLYIKIKKTAKKTDHKLSLTYSKCTFSKGLYACHIFLA